MKDTGQSGGFKTTSSEIVHSNPWFKVRRDGIIHPNGKKGEYFVVDTTQNVTIVAMNKKQEICLIRLFRYPTQTMSWELPSGGVEDDGSLAAAKRELQEESGLEASKWTRLAELQMANGLASQRGDMYLAENLSETPESEQEEEGIEAVEMVSIEKVLKMIGNGEITDLISIAAVTLVAQRLSIGLK